MKLSNVSAVAIVILLSSMAFAWPKCNGTWVQVPPGTKGPGEIYKDKEGTWECITAPVAVKVSNTNTNQNQNSNTNQNNSTSSSTSSATASGNGNNSNDSVTNVAASKIPVGPAYSPSALPTAPCTKGYGFGGNTVPASISFGGSKVDENCVILEAARSLALHGSDLAYCMVMITHKALKKAGVTLEKCMVITEPPAPPIPPIPPAPVAPQIIVPPPQVTVNIPPIVFPTPPPSPAPPKPAHHHRRAECPSGEKAVCVPSWFTKDKVEK